MVEEVKKEIENLTDIDEIEDYDIHEKFETIKTNQQIEEMRLKIAKDKHDDLLKKAKELGIEVKVMAEDAKSSDYEKAIEILEKQIADKKTEDKEQEDNKAKELEEAKNNYKQKVEEAKKIGLELEFEGIKDEATKEEYEEATKILEKQIADKKAKELEEAKNKYEQKVEEATKLGLQIEKIKDEATKEEYEEATKILEKQIADKKAQDKKAKELEEAKNKYEQKVEEATKLGLQIEKIKDEATKEDYEKATKKLEEEIADKKAQDKKVEELKQAIKKVEVEDKSEKGTHQEITNEDVIKALESKLPEGYKDKEVKVIKIENKKMAIKVDGIELTDIELVLTPKKEETKELEINSGENIKIMIKDGGKNISLSLEGFNNFEGNVLKNSVKIEGNTIKVEDIENLNWDKLKGENGDRLRAYRITILENDTKIAKVAYYEHGKTNIEILDGYKKPEDKVKELKQAIGKVEVEDKSEKGTHQEITNEDVIEALKSKLPEGYKDKEVKVIKIENKKMVIKVDGIELTDIELVLTPKKEETKELEINSGENIKIMIKYGGKNIKKTLEEFNNFEENLLKNSVKIEGNTIKVEDIENLNWDKLKGENGDRLRAYRITILENDTKIAKVAYYEHGKTNIEILDGYKKPEDEIKDDEIKDDETKEDETKDDETKDDETKEDETKEDETKDDETKEDETKDDEIKDDEIKEEK